MRRCQICGATRTISYRVNGSTTKYTLCKKCNTEFYHSKKSMIEYINDKKGQDTIQ